MARRVSVAPFRLTRGGRWALAPDDSVRFGLRLLLSFGLTLLLVGVVGYALIVRELRSSQINRYAAEQRTDVAVFEAKGRRAPTPAGAIRQIDEVLDAIAQRPGTLEALLIDRDGLVVAAGDGRIVGLRDMDERVEGALRRGRSYAGHESDPEEDGGNFEFVSPVHLPSGRYAYEVSFDHHTFDGQLADLRRILVLIEVLTLLGGAGIFYVVGGRTLMQDHRLALDRANRDGLTGLPNQRAFHDELERAVGLALRRGGPLALAVLDLDDFKLVNDRYGHPHGDELLRRVAAVLRERPGCRVYRIGGDEFALLARTDGDGIRMIATDLDAGMAAAGIPVSIGMAGLRPGQTAESLHLEADEALYAAKRRNRVVAAAPAYGRIVAG